MRVEFVVFVYNHVMRRRRRELRMSQAVLSDLSGVSLADIGAFEMLRQVGGTVWDVCQKMNRLATALDIDQAALFPADYLVAVQAFKLPRRHIPFEFVREVSLDALTSGAKLLSLPSPDDEVDCLNPIPKEIINEMLDRLPLNCRGVIEMRYGLLDGDSHTLEEVARHFKLSRERVRQIEFRGLRQLRGLARNNETLREIVS